MKHGKWKYHKGFKNRPAHYFPPTSKFDGWEKAQCGFFAYPDMLEEEVTVGHKVRRLCLKCLKFMD